MAYKAPTRIEEFIATDAAGQSYRVVIWQEWVDASTLQEKHFVPGLKAAKLADGRSVNYINENTYEIVGGARLTRVR